jgi:hypothetical protein
MAVLGRVSSSMRERARTAPLPEVVALLRAMVGPGLVASIAGVKAKERVDDWANGTAGTSLERQQRLRVALEASLIVLEDSGLDEARAWLTRPSRELGRRSPAAVLREEPPESARDSLVPAAKRAARGRMATAARRPAGY